MPEPKTELNFVNPYTLLVAVALSAQATDVSVNKATEALFKKVKTPQEMLDLGLENLISYIKTIGLYNTKAKNVMATAEILIREYDGEVPQDRDILETLPGVGRKTANVVVNEAFGQPTIAVDTHIFRVSNRTGMAVAPTPNKVETLLGFAFPKFLRKVLITGLSCMAAIPALRASLNVAPARLLSIAILKRKHRLNNRPIY